jgi:hypothetical protein
MAPNTKASDHPNPGIKVWAIQATAHVVKITQPVARRVIGRFAFLKSIQEVVQAAAYNIGGRNTRKTTSGCKVIWGNPGKRPMPIPASTSKIGYGILILSVTSARAVTIASRIITVAIFSMHAHLNGAKYRVHSNTQNVVSF